MTESFANAWKEIAAYGGPAIMGVMQAEIQERRQWTSKPRFLEGLGTVFGILRAAVRV
jgi:chromate transport protein ChrA